MGFQPRIDIEQSLDTEVPYVLRVIDDQGQADEDASVIRVVDTTPPALACNAPPTLEPPDAPISFTARATDICDAEVTPDIVDFTCFKLTKKGKRIDKTSSCVVSVEGDTIRVLDSGGVGDHIQWDLRAVDDSGNESVATCEVLVVRPSNGG